MPAVILTILKIIGIILLIAVGIVLFLLLVILFWPIRYELDGDIREAAPDHPEEPLAARVTVRAKVSWILRLVRGIFVYPKKEGDRDAVHVFFAFLQLYPRRKKRIRFGRRRRRRAPAARKEKDARLTGQREDDVQTEDSPEKSPSGRDTEESDRKTTGCDDKGSFSDEGTEAGDSEVPEKQTEAEGMDVSPENGQNGKTGKNTDRRTDHAGDDRKRRRHVPFTKRVERLRRGFVTLSGKPELAAKKIYYTISGFCDKVRKVRAWSQSQSLSRAKQLLLNEARRVLRHLIPRKCRVALRYGAEDPKQTADIYGMICACYPVLSDHVEFTPVFDEETLSGTIRIRGRVVLFVLVFAFLRCYLSRDVRRSKARWDAIRGAGEDENNG